MNSELEALQTLIEKATEFCVAYSFQIIGAIIILIIAFFVGGWIQKLVQKILLSKKLDPTLTSFISSSIRITILTFATIIALGKFGITIAPFVAAIGAAAFGATYAIQGPLSNFGAGIAIIIGRPFVLGDTITVGGSSGTVTAVKLAYTILVTEDDEEITIPNKKIVGEVMVNSKSVRLIEGVVGISYSEKPEKTKKLITQVLSQNPDISNKPEPMVGIESFGDSAINIQYRYWVSPDKYVKSKFDINLQVFKTLQENEVDIPFPQRVVTMIQK